MRPTQTRSCRRLSCGAINGLESFESRAEFGTWIYRIAVNCALNMINKRKVEATYQIGEETDPSQHQVQVADTAAEPRARRS